jgi:NAD(P)-dependent dehydrogenase (short-subunit alcohol dehydrogenase family)
VLGDLASDAGGGGRHRRAGRGDVDILVNNAGGYGHRLWSELDAADWAGTYQVNVLSGVRLVNISLAGPYNKILDRSLHQAVSKGMIIVAAAGNTGADSPPRYPAAFDGVIAGRDSPAPTAPCGPTFRAPGVDVFGPRAAQSRCAATAGAPGGRRSSGARCDLVPNDVGRLGRPEEISGGGLPGQSLFDNVSGAVLRVDSGTIRSVN